MGKSDKEQFRESRRNVKRNLLKKWAKKDRPRFTNSQGRLVGRVLQGKEGYFFKNPSGEIHKIFMNSVEGDENYIEFHTIKVENIDYIHHPENDYNKTWGKMRG